MLTDIQSPTAGHRLLEPRLTPPLPLLGLRKTPMPDAQPQSEARGDQHCNNKCLQQQQSSLSPYPCAKPFQPPAKPRCQPGKGGAYPTPTQVMEGGCCLGQAARDARSPLPAPPHEVWKLWLSPQNHGDSPLRSAQPSPGQQSELGALG